MFILVVEDDFHTSRALEIILRTEGHTSEVTASGRDALAFARDFQPDAMLLDLMLPDISGYAVLSRLRAAKSMLPVIVVSGMDSVEDRVKAFRAGADDYLTKPFHRDELMARIRSVTRRCHGHADDVVRVGNLEVDLERKFARVGGANVIFSKQEFQLLELLFARPGSIISRDAIMDRLYGGDGGAEMKIIDVIMCKIRTKLANASGGLNFIETVWGRGYVARDPATCLAPPNGHVARATIDALAEARAYDAANAGRAA